MRRKRQLPGTGEVRGCYVRRGREKKEVFIFLKKKSTWRMGKFEKFSKKENGEQRDVFRI